MLGAATGNLMTVLVGMRKNNVICGGENVDLKNLARLQRAQTCMFN